LSGQDDFIKSKSIYLNFGNGQMNYFTDKNFDDQVALKKKHQLSLKYNYSNLYINWLNPLRYKITWKDSTYTDDRDQAVNSFIGLLANQFGSPLTGLSKSDPAKSLPAGIPAIGGTPLAKPKSGNVNSLDLLQLYLSIQNDITFGHKITEPELVTINSLLDKLFVLDELSIINVSDSVEKAFIRLYSISSHKEVERQCKSERDRMNDIDIAGDVNKLQVMITDLAEKIKVGSDKILEAFIKKSAIFITSSISTESKKNHVLISNLESVIVMVESSIQERESQSQGGFFFIRSISFDPGKVLETELTITEYEYSSGKMEFSKKSDIYQSVINFRKSDFVIVAVSAGIFYSQATLKGFGVTAINNQLSVTEDDIQENTPVAATFLNLCFNLDSRYFSPLIQLGIDPTKKYPYLLAGIGFSIPAARFSLSGGPLWTWDASLNKLSVGGFVSSTTELEKDVKYKFDVRPKGWYLGLQYNF
jgi:hypothetical protein